MKNPETKQPETIRPKSRSAHQHPMTARMTGSPQRTGKPKRHDEQPRIEMAADGTHVRAQRYAIVKGTCRLRVDRKVLPVSGLSCLFRKGGMRQKGRGENGESRTCPQNGCSPCANGCYKRRRRSQKRKYKRETGKAETGESCSSLPMCLFAVVTKIPPS